MTTPNSQFYVVGGTVNPDSPSYVVRRADQELYDRLLAGEFCYVLTSRQMGKSSLMARTARRLTNEAHIHAAIVDLTQIGTERDKLSAEQWYYGIAHRILREVGLRDVNLNEWWQSRSSLSGLQRLTEFFRDLLLERIAGQIVIFIDEIDSTISLPFTDDFFAAIRACHNARATDAAYNRLSFVLLGVASPSDLVKDSTRTPFNVGQRIELTDFTAEEAKPLAAGLSANGQDGEQILARILDWTGGHPYLTQKLCGAMQNPVPNRDSDGAAAPMQNPDREGGADADVDALVEQNFLSQTASRDDYNLNFVRDWMKGDKKLSIKVFKLYRNIRRGKAIADAPRSLVQNHLKLSGIVALRPDKILRVRNRVYERVFTDQWLKSAMPVDWNRNLFWVSILTAFCLGVWVWWLVSPNSQAYLGMKEMNIAWRNKRSGETRISAFQYAPWVQTRDGSDPVADYVARDNALQLLLSAINEHPSDAVHHALGRFYLANREFDKAIEKFEFVLKTEPNNANAHSDLGAALIEKGKIVNSDELGQRLLNTAKAIEHLNRALELDGFLLEAIFNRALCFQLMRLSTLSQKDWERYIKLDADSDWTVEARQYLKQLEDQRRKTFLGREEQYQQFLDAWHSKDDDAVWRVVSQNRTPFVGSIEDRLIDEYLISSAKRGNYNKQNLEALRLVGNLLNQHTGDRFTVDLADYYQRADPHRTAISAYARELMKNAQARYAMSMISEAIILFSQARTAFAKAGDGGNAMLADFYIGNCYVRESELADGESILTRVSQMAQKRSYRWLAHRALSTLADANIQSNEFSQAIMNSSHSLEIADNLGDVTAIVRSLAQLAGEYRILNQGVKSLDYVVRGLELVQNAQLDDKQRWTIYADAGITLNAIRLPAAALSYQKEGLQIAENLQNPFLLIRAQTYLGQTYSQLGNYEEAISIFKQAIELSEKQGESLTAKETMAYSSLQIGNYYRQVGNNKLAIEWYERSLHLSEQIGYSSYSYLARKGKLLASFGMHDDTATAKELPEVLNLLDRYRSTILLESQRNTFFDQEQSVYDIAIDFEYSRRYKPEQAFEYSETSRARSLLDLLHTTKPTIEKKQGVDLELSSLTKPLTLSEVRARLPEEVQLLQYAVLKDKLLIWHITKNSWEAQASVVTSEALSEKVRQFRNLISNPPRDSSDREVQQIAAELYSLLIGPIEKSLSSEKIICIIPDKSLQYLPYQALFSPIAGSFLIEKFNLMYAASSSAFVASTETAKARSRITNDFLLSVGDPRFDAQQFPHLPHLPPTVKEATDIAKFYPHHLVLIGEQATEIAVRQALAHAQVAHLATHYLIDEQSVMYSKFIFARNESMTNNSNSDGVLQNFEIYQLKLPFTKLVVLSGAQTGIEQSFNGEGGFGAARPFIAIGVPLVIASLFCSDSDTTTDLMVEFQRQRCLLKNTTVQALRQAQLYIMHGPNERHRHPFFWASFGLFGGYAKF